MTDIFLNVLLITGSLSFVLVALIRHYLSRYLLDIPNDRSSHTIPTPRGGGLGFVIAFGIASAVLPFISFADNPLLEPAYALKIWAVLLPLAVIGVLDDQRDIPARVRYLVQLLAASIAVFFFGAFPQPWLTQFGLGGVIVAVVLTVVGVTAMINFYNFMDGLDGLVAGVTAVQLGFLAVELHQPLLMLLVVALMGFLCWNWSPAKIFMGDVGSTVLGAIVAIALLSHSGSVEQNWAFLTITLPLVADAIYTLGRRALRRENIFQGHRTHIYQRLNQAGWSHRHVAGTYIFLTLAIAEALHFLGGWGAIGSIVGILTAIVTAERYLQRVSRTAVEKSQPVLPKIGVLIRQ
jgi:Fuc2NAc and GlcNAc transferase